jgi:hypothetical protein
LDHWLNILDFFSELFPIFQIFVENSKLFWDYYYCSFFQIIRVVQLMILMEGHKGGHGWVEKAGGEGGIFLRIIHPRYGQ